MVMNQDKGSMNEFEEYFASFNFSLLLCASASLLC